MFQKADRPAMPAGLSALAQRRRRVPPRHRSARVAPASSARCSRSFPPASRTRRRSRDYLAWLLRALQGLPVAVELRHRSWSDDPARRSRCSNDVRRRVGADRRAEVPLLDPAELPAERAGLLLHAAARPERRRSGGATTSPRIATTTCIRPTSCRSSPKRPSAASRVVKKVYLYTNNHFSAKSVANAAMIKQQLGEPIDGEYPRGVRRALSRSDGPREDPAAVTPSRKLVLITSPR